MSIWVDKQNEVTLDSIQKFCDVWAVTQKNSFHETSLIQIVVSFERRCGYVRKEKAFTWRQTLHQLSSSSTSSSSSSSFSPSSCSSSSSSSYSSSYCFCSFSSFSASCRCPCSPFSWDYPCMRSPASQGRADNHDDGTQGQKLTIIPYHLALGERFWFFVQTGNNEQNYKIIKQTNI